MPQGPVNSGDNTTNATGSVTILYPSGQPPIPWSPAFVVANVAAKFDIKPSAGRFTLSVVATIGTTTVDGTTVQFDPVLGQFTANVPAPTSAERLGDFSGTGITAADFACGSSSTSCPFPGNIVPLSRQDPKLLAALKSVFLPNTPRDGVHSFFTVTGGAKPGSTFTWGGSTNVALTAFASLAAIPYPTADVPVTVTLYVDGQVVGGASTTFKPPK
jgi:hypothetical protein